MFNLDSAQIGGVDSTVRKTEVTLAENAKLNVMEKLMTHDKQTAVSDMTVELNGAGSTARIISRSVAKGTSVQTFHPIAVGNALCHAHVQCDSIIMDQAQISTRDLVYARNIDAQIIHEAAIGRINNDQILKLAQLRPDRGRGGSGDHRGLPGISAGLCREGKRPACGPGGKAARRRAEGNMGQLPEGDGRD